MADKAVTQAGITDSTSDYNALNFVIFQALGRINTIKIVEIMPFITGQNSGTVNVRPMVGMMSGADVETPHETIYNIPFFRLQSGLNGVIIDPQVGDIGACGFCDRDISVVKKTGKRSPPGSYRKFDYADGLYFGGIMMLNIAPTQFIRFDGYGITITSPVAITVNAPINTINGNLNVNGNTTFLGSVTANGRLIDDTHHHNGVQTGSGNTGPVT